MYQVRGISSCKNTWLATYKMYRLGAKGPSELFRSHNFAHSDNHDKCFYWTRIHTFSPVVTLSEDAELRNNKKYKIADTSFSPNFFLSNALISHQHKMISSQVICQNVCNSILKCNSALNVILFISWFHN